MDTGIDTLFVLESYTVIQEAVQSHSVPGGELIEAPYVRVVFQRGFPSDVGINGCRVDDVIRVAIDKLESYQLGELACEENAEALRYLKLARQTMAARIQRRKEQGVLNTMCPHTYERTEDENEDFSATGA